MLLRTHGPPMAIDTGSGGSAISSLSTSPTREMCRNVRQKLAHESLAFSRVEKAIEKGVQAGLQSFLSATTVEQNNRGANPKSASTSDESKPASSALVELEAMRAKLRARPVPKSTSKQANYNQFAALVEKMDKNERYKHALKEATKLVSSREMGSREAVLRVNEKYNLNSKLCKSVTKSTVNRYVKRGKTGESPLKMGPAQKMPPEFNGLLHAHLQMK